MNITVAGIEIVISDETITWTSFCGLMVIFALYLWFVLDAGPKFMKKRDPINVTQLLRAYNIYQVIVCCVYVTRAYQLGFTFKFVYKCERFEFLNDAARREILIGSWLFLGLRIFEFVETIFFVLRKKEKQASFLHIFHHIGSVLMTWIFIVAHTELMAVYIAMINSSIHVVMYLYYYLSSFRSKKLENVLRYIKPCITIMQLVQFVIIIGHCIVAILPNCHMSFFFHLQIFNFILLFILFGKFFVLTYVKTKSKIVPIA